jgi:hypothetical protein
MCFLRVNEFPVRSSVAAAARNSLENSDRMPANWRTGILHLSTRVAALRRDLQARQACNVHSEK